MSREHELVDRPAAGEIVGFRHIETGAVLSVRGAYGVSRVRELTARGDYEPVYVGGPGLVAPLLEALIRMAEDRTEGSLRRSNAFLGHRLEAQRALGEFVRMGGQIP